MFCTVSRFGGKSCCLNTEQVTLAQPNKAQLDVAAEVDANVIVPRSGCFFSVGFFKQTSK